MKTSLIAGVLAALALAAMPSVASAQVPAVCPATFTVLHNDSIGALSVPAGHYQLTATGISCHAASDRFRQFLEDFDGRLPRPWRLDVASATFSGGGASISIARVTTPGGGGSGGRHPATGVHCPSTFQVLHNDRIGSFEVPAGPYTVTLLSVGPLSCSQTTRLLARFLQDFDGRLPRPWVLDQATGTFLRGSASVGFRIDPAAQPSGGGGGTHPAGRRCPGTFRVQHDDRIGALRLPAGRYRVTLAASRRPTCVAAGRLLARFLQRGRTTRPWRVRASTATFSRPSGAGFSVKPVA